jgi:hypothetical protein
MRLYVCSGLSCKWCDASFAKDDKWFLGCKPPNPILGYRVEHFKKVQVIKGELRTDHDN